MISKSIIKKSRKIGMTPLIVAKTSLFSTQALAPMLSWTYRSHRSSDIFPTSATMDGAAASRREDRKVASYEKERYPGGLAVRVVPLVLEHFGRWGKKAVLFR